MENENMTNVEVDKAIAQPQDTEFGGLKIASTGIFNRYVDIADFAGNLARDLVYKGYFRETGKRKRSLVEGLIMSDEQLQVGALSIGPALSTLFIELDLIDKDNVEEFRRVLLQSAVEDDPQKTKKDKDGEFTLLRAIENSILHLIAECYSKDKDGRTSIVFEASPFYSESDGNDETDTDNVRWNKIEERFYIKNKHKEFEEHVCDVGGYLDTASWVFVVSKLARDFLSRVISMPRDNDDPNSVLLDFDTEWAIPAGLLSADLNIKTTQNIIDALNDLYMASLRFACRCIVYDKDGNYSGWMFTNSRENKPTYTPDLYLSYAASTIYLGLYKEYSRAITNSNSAVIENKNALDELRLLESFMYAAKRVINNDYNTVCKERGLNNDNYFSCFERKNRNIEKLKNYVGALWEKMSGNQPRLDEATKIFNYGIANPDMHRDIVSVYDEVKEFLNYLDDQGRLDLGKKKNGSGMLNSIEFLFYAINGAKPLTRPDKNAYVATAGESNGSYSNTPIYTILKEATVSSARHFWEGNGDNSFKKNMALGPCYSDGSLAVEDSYSRAGHSNVLFNNLFVIGLIINSAYDVDVLKTDVAAYNDMLQAFQITVQDTQRRYNQMSRDHTIYKVNSYMLEFSEQVDVENGKIASKLRRVNITGCYLLPILFKTNGIIEDYLIQYPQIEMVKSFKTIIANRKKKKGSKEYYWVWDKDGYNAISNYYYVDALVTFYRYYNTYEKDFTLSREESNKEIEKLKNEFATSLEELKNQYAEKLRKEKDDLATKLNEEEITPLKEELSRFKGWQSAICDFIVGGIAQSLNKAFSLSPDRWLTTSNDDPFSQPLGRFKNFIESGSNSDLTSLIAWFSKLQLTTLLNSQWTLGLPDALTLDNDTFRKNVVDKITNDQQAVSTLASTISTLASILDLLQKKNDENNNQ